VKSISGYWLRSRFIREEVLRTSIIVVLFSWAVTASLIALLKQDRTILIGVADESSYVISQSNETLRRKEIVSFVRGFIASYYEFTPTNHAEKISRAGDLMAAPLWESKRAGLLSINDRLKADPLVQSAKVLSIDLIDEQSVEALIQIQINKRIESITTNLKVTLKVHQRERTESNPWPFEIAEVSDAVL
jgi:hypothetical protein